MRQMAMLGSTDEIDEIQASLLRALASAHRLRIIHRLGIGLCEVNKLARDLGLSQASASRHVAAVRAVGFVEAVRDGRTARYELSDPEILAACSMTARRARPAALPARRPRPQLARDSREGAATTSG